MELLAEVRNPFERTAMADLRLAAPVRCAVEPDRVHLSLPPAGQVTVRWASRLHGA